MVVALLLLSPIAFAVSQEYESGEDYNGAPTWDYYKTKLSLWDKILINKPLTVVNGAQCSQSADYSKSGVTTTTSLCWDNKNGGSPNGEGVVHQGVAYQVFLSDDGKFERVSEIGVQANTEGCIPVTPNKNYYRQAFYCDSTSKTCTKEVSICNTPTGVVRERTCLYPDGTNKREVVTDPNWKDSSVGTCKTGQEVGTLLPSNQQSVTAGSSGSGQTPQPVTLSGTYGNVIVPDNVEAGEYFVVSGTFKASNAGLYYLESTVFANKLAVVSASGSKCDGSKQSAGEFVQLAANEEALMTFNLQAPSASGVKTVVVGAYTACFKDGGKEITSVADDINVLSENAGVSSGGFDLVDGVLIFGLAIGGLMALSSFFPPFGFILGALIGGGLGYWLSLII